MMMSECGPNEGGCSSCSSNLVLAQMGLEIGKADYVVALAGNPNTGKSSVFNSLTGLRQHTGNWPGKTVARAEGGFSFGGKRYKLVDLPGTYSLLSAAEDEEIARDFILFGQPDCTVVVTDATCLERNLNLVLQILEVSDRVVVALNLMDEAKRKGIDVDVRGLARELGVPVVGTVARTGEGLSALLEAIAGVAAGEIVNEPYRVMGEGAVQDAVAELVPMLEDLVPGLANARWVAMRLLDGDFRVQEALVSGELAEVMSRQLAAAVRPDEYVPLSTSFAGGR